jgi:hypothetical protein
VELNAAVAESFFAHLDNGRIEKNIVAMPMRERGDAHEERRDRPHRAEGLRLIAQDLGVLGEVPAWKLGKTATRLARNARVCAAIRPVCDGRPGGIPDDDPAVGLWYRRPHATPVSEVSE